MSRRLLLVVAALLDMFGSSRAQVVWFVVVVLLLLLLVAVVNDVVVTVSVSTMLLLACCGPAQPCSGGIWTEGGGEAAAIRVPTRIRPESLNNWTQCSAEWVCFGHGLLLCLCVVSFDRRLRRSNYQQGHDMITTTTTVLYTICLTFHCIYAMPEQHECGVPGPFGWESEIGWSHSSGCRRYWSGVVRSTRNIRVGSSRRVIRYTHAHMSTVHAFEHQHTPTRTHQHVV